LRSHRFDHQFTPFTPALVTEALQKSSYSTATGPDGLCSLHLKHLSQSAISYLTDAFILSVKDSVTGKHKNSDPFYNKIPAIKNFLLSPTVGNFIVKITCYNKNPAIKNKIFGPFKFVKARFWYIPVI
jgi:hypothetical protein